MLQRPANTHSGESWAKAASAGNLPERLVIVTDAWHPQVNGVVRSIENTNRELAKMGVEVSMVTPERFNSIPGVSLPEIHLL